MSVFLNTVKKWDEFDMVYSCYFRVMVAFIAAVPVVASELSVVPFF